MKNISFLLSLSWKYVHRHKGRSFFIIFSVVLSVFISIFILAFFNGIFEQIERAVVDTNTGFFQLQEKNFSDSEDTSNALPLNSELSDKLRAPWIKGHSPELVMESHITQPEGSASLVLIGVEPELNKTVIPLDQHILEGSFLQKDDQGILIGKELASFFKFNVGDNFLINYQDINGELKSELLPIVGIYDFNSNSFQKRFVYVTQKTWEKLYFNEMKATPYFHRIVVNTSGLQDENLIKETFKDFPFEIKTWKNINPEMSVVLDFNGGLIKLFLIIIAITVALTILNPVRLLWEERLKEFKMLTTLGISRGTFVKLGIIEAGIMILLSLSLSLTIVVITILILTYTGIDFTFLTSGRPIERAGIELPSIIYPTLTSWHGVYTLILVIATLGFGYAWAMWNTLKKLRRIA